MNKPTHVFAYTNEQGLLVAFDHKAPGQEYSCMHSLTLEQLQQQKQPSMQLMTIEDFDAANNAQYTTPPVEITRDEFTDALYILWPEDFTNTGNTGSFKWSERLNPDITWIFVRVDGRYFKLANRTDMPHGDIVAACRKLIKETA